jgi:hypothetical protein
MSPAVGNKEGLVGWYVGRMRTMADRRVCRGTNGRVRVRDCERERERARRGGPREWYLCRSRQETASNRRKRRRKKRKEKKKRRSNRQ